MGSLLPFIVAGLAAGSVYGLAGTGLVITYKTTGIFNFAYPAMAAAAAYIFFLFQQDTVYLNVRWPWPVAAFIAIGVAGPLMGMAMERIDRGLVKVATSLQVLATIGIGLSVIGVLGLLYQNNPGLYFQPFLPQSTFRLLGTYITWQAAILFLFAAASATALYYVFRATRLGMGMRAVVDDPNLLDLTGTSSVAIRRSAWLIGGVFAAASGVLLGPTVGLLNGEDFFVLTIAAFGAAALGKFRSLPLTFCGGLVIGILGALSAKFQANVSWLAGLNPALPFLVLFVVLIALNPRTLADRRVSRPRPLRAAYYAPWPPRLALGVLVFGLLAAIPLLLPNDLALWATGLTYVILFLSLTLLVRESGQVSLSQVGFAAVGGVAFAHSAAQWGLPWLVALVFAGVVAAGAGILVALPAIRVSGVFLALATLGFGLALQSLVYPTGIMFTTEVDGLPSIPRPSFALTDRSFYYLLLVCTLIVTGVLLSIRFGRLGRLLRALSDSPLALNTMGTSINATKLIVFAMSAFIAGIAGALYSSYAQRIGLDTPMFQPLQSLELFAIVMLVAGGIPWGALQAGIAFSVLPDYLQRWFPSAPVSSYGAVLFGASAAVVAVQADRAPSLPRSVIRFCERFRRGKPIQVTEAVRVAPAGKGLEVEELNVTFGGLTAVKSLSLRAPFGQITGLIGPNGAGKTTTFNACSGLVAPSSGRLMFQGSDIRHFSPARRARLGIGRTFQRAELWDTLTVLENVALGCEAPFAGRNYLAQFRATRSESRQVYTRAVEAMAAAGISDIADRQVGDLSTGQRRLVELARVLAGPFDLLLLDEPSSGLDRSETERFGGVLKRVVSDRGTGVLLVEHDMQLVMAICENIFVMDFGEQIYEGTPVEVAASSAVRAAYLGSEDVDAAAATPPDLSRRPETTAASSRPRIKPGE
jgi:ABC-type branched-subunit amino acid transport system ATPase component/ABC-type branched-subunit amino acid transport system permease subunit